MELGHDLKVLVFDLDGTLVHLDLDWADLRDRLRPIGPLESLGAAMQRLVLAHDPLLAAVTEAELAALGERRVERAVGLTLDKLAASFHLAIFTRNSREVALRAVEGIRAAADIFVVGREDCRLLKPAPEGLRLILDHFRVAAGQAAVIGDTCHDVRAAAAVGATAIVVRNDRLAREPTGAAHYIDRLSELLSLLT